MRLRAFIVPAVLLAAVSGLSAAGYVTRDRWLSHVFPTEPSAKSDHDHGEDGHGHSHAGGDRVKLSAQAQANLGLEVDTLVPREHWRTVFIPGAVVDRPGESDRGVPTKVAGVVTDIKARPGDTVRASDPLFTIQLVSEFVQSAQTELGKVAREREFAVIRRDRIAGLVKAGTKPEQELIDEEIQVKRLTTQIEGYRRQLLALGLTQQQVESAQRGEVVTEVVVAAPAGAVDDTLYEVQELNVQLGAAVQAGQSLAVLANHQRLFVEGRAFKSEADALAEAAQKKFPIQAEFADEVPDAWPAQSPLVIHHLSNQVDPVTRTFAFYLSLDNQPRTYIRDGKTHFVWRYRPGQRVRLKVPVKKFVTYGPDGKTPILPFVLPAGAVVREGPEAFVFVQNGDIFVRKPVRVLYEDRAEVVIANDGSVTPAEFVVKNQAAAINRALKSAAGGGEHGHDHGHSHDH